MFAPKKLRAMRKKRNLTQTELAKRAKISQSFVSKLESGDHVPSLKVLTRIARALKMPVSHFVPNK